MALVLPVPLLLLLLLGPCLVISSRRRWFTVSRSSPGSITPKAEKSCVPSSSAAADRIAPRSSITALALAASVAAATADEAADEAADAGAAVMAWGGAERAQAVALVKGLPRPSMTR